jgi:glycosyltransferase involved in cell wall biosynthesis
VFPTRDEPRRGVFVRHRLVALASLAPLRVVAPIGIIRWGASGRWRFGGPHPKQGAENTVPVYYPRWFYPPSASWLNGVLLFVQLLPLLARMWRRERWDVLDAHFGHPEGVAAALLAMVFRCPYTITLRGLELEQTRVGLRRRLVGWALRRSNRVFAVSRELRELALELGVDPHKALVSANGVDGLKFHPVERAAARLRVGVESGTRLIFSAGRLDPAKGVLELLDAVCRLLVTVPQARLVLAGGPGRGSTGYAAEVRRICSGPDLAGKVTLLPEISQDELVEWMNAADVCCLASRREGCPNVVLEALACGVPVVSTAVGAVPDLIPSTAYGLVVPPGDPAALADALARALALDWNREGIAAWGQSRSWDHVAGELQPEFEKVLLEFTEQAGRCGWTSQ